MERALVATEQLHAPQLLDVEIAQVLRRVALHREISAARAKQALADLEQLPIKRHIHQPLVRRIWQLRDSLTAYDAAYVALAKALPAPLLTCDPTLAHAHGHRAAVELVAANYRIGSKRRIRRIRARKIDIRNRAYGKSVLPIKYRSHSRAAPRPSLMAHTTRL
jgi:predicted nucleic acid-binding protein